MGVWSRQLPVSSLISEYLGTVKCGSTVTGPHSYTISESVWLSEHKRVGVEPRTSALNMTLPAQPQLEHLQLSVRGAGSNRRYLLPAPRLRQAADVARRDRQRDGRTDTRPLRRPRTAAAYNRHYFVYTRNTNKLLHLTGSQRTHLSYLWAYRPRASLAAHKWPPKVPLSVGEFIHLIHGSLGPHVQTRNGTSIGSTALAQLT